MRTEPSGNEPAPFVDLEHRPHQDQIYRQLLDAAPDAVVVVDAQGRIVFASKQTEQLFGYARGALLGEAVEVLVPERLRAAHAAQRGRFATAPRLRPMGTTGLELWGRRRDGSEFPIEISLGPVTTEDGTLLSASIRDVSQRREADAVVRRSQAHLSSAVESIQGGFAIFDAEDRLVLCNSGFRQLVASQLSGEVVGRNFIDLLQAMALGVLHDDAGGAPVESRWAAYHAAPSGAIDVRACTGQHLRVMERRTAEGGTVTTISDVTDDVQHEEELRSARQLAEAASSAKSDFLASMSHELRTPLNAVLGFAQLLQRDRRNPLSPRQLERVEYVLQGGEHLLRLIDDVLDLSRIESGRILVSLERVAVADVLAEVKATLDPMAARAGVQIRIQPVAEGSGHVMADRTRLKQILMNYGSNAVKYGRPQGTATFSTSRRDDITRIAVTDDGIGVASDKQARLFQPFQRAGQEAGPIEGTGIGLVISKRLAELMGGGVGFESIEAEGSTFWIELPLPAAAAAAVLAGASTPEGAASALAGPDGPRYVVVYVEDNPSNIAFMYDLLADFERVELLTAPTAEIGIEVARARQPDVVIMDINLPGMSGIEASRLLKSWPETQHIPIIALSAAAMIRDAARMSGAGFYRYLTKPVQVDELASTLEELLAPSR